MKPISFVTAAGMVLAFLCLLPVPAQAWLSYSVPAVRGTVTDATTGQPIKDAVFVVKWEKTVYGPWDPQTALIRKMYVATDENGIFRIPAKSSVHLISEFMDIVWVVRHPFYETKQLGISREQINFMKDVMKNPDKKMSELTEHLSAGSAGEIVFDIALLSLSDKYSEITTIPGFLGRLEREFFLEGPKYIHVAKQLGISFNTESIYVTWDDIANRFSNEEFIRSAVEEGKKKISEGYSGD